jgi:hypothetical protein
MTSWLAARNPIPRKPLREGYFQALPEGTFSKEDLSQATVVTAYYEMKSKHSVEKYRDWIRTFFRTVQAPIVFFTDAETLPFLESCPRATTSIKFIVLPRSEWKANTSTLFPAGTWEKQYAADPEKAIHSVELYKVWYEKKEFVLKAIEANPFQSKKFVWTDAGCMRDPVFEQILQKNYPVGSRIPEDRILLLNVAPFTKSDEIVDTINGVTIKGGGKDRVRIGGTIIAGTAAVWKRWSELCDEAVQRFLKAGIFMGKDQTIFATVVLENKNFVSLLDSKKIAPNPWLYPLLYLGVPDSVFKILRSDRADKERWAYERFLKECH